jgi:hypothetical protein
VYAAAVFSLSYFRTYNEEIGFATANVLSMRLTLPADLLMTSLKAAPGNRATVRLEEAIRLMPGVAAVSHTNGAPFGGNATRGEVRLLTATVKRRS